MKTKKAPEPFIPGKDYTLEELVAFQGPKPTGAETVAWIEEQRKINAEEGLLDDYQERYDDLMAMRRESRERPEKRPFNE